jgi:hypothetical protein
MEEALRRTGIGGSARALGVDGQGAVVHVGE